MASSCCLLQIASPKPKAFLINTSPTKPKLQNLNHKWNPPTLSFSLYTHSHRSRPFQNIKCYPQRQREEEEQSELERLFSAVLVIDKHLVTQTETMRARKKNSYIGAGILAVPAVTQEAGFLASAVAFFVGYIWL